MVFLIGARLDNLRNNFNFRALLRILVSHLVAISAMDSSIS